MNEADLAQPTLSPVKKIRAEITAYEKEYGSWRDRGKGVIERYRDERSEPVNQTFVLRKYNILWANIQTLKPTLYARIPQVEVERRFKDQDPVGRLAAEIAERMGNYVLQTSDADEIFKQVVMDNLLPGRGVAWVNYEVEGEDKPVMEDYTDEAGKSAKRPKMRKTEKGEEAETEFEKIHEAVSPEYVDWRDFGHSPVRTWGEVETVWRITYMEKTELEKRFGKEKAKDIPLDRKVKDDKEKTDNVIPQSTIYVAWHKPTHKVYWLHKEVAEELDVSDPPVKLEGFWPTTKPLYATVTNDTLIPIPDFVLYQDQANELDVITNRIARITDALKAVGVYDQSTPQLQRLLMPNGTPDNTLVPVDTWAAFKEKGGLAGAIELVPIDMLAKVLIGLYEARDQIIQVIFQVTGIGDIMRGSTDPRETATAQQIKGQYGSIRIRDRQAEVATFCRDIARLIIECGIQMFEPKLIAEMTMAQSFCPLSPQEQMALQMGQEIVPQSFMQALALLKNDRLRTFHIDIETDSTIAMDEQAEKQSVTEFITAVGAFFQSFGPVVQEQPALLPVAGEMLLYATRRFRAGRTMETTIEKAVQQMVQQSSQPKPPDPKLIQAQANAQSATAKADAEKVRSQADIIIAQTEAQGVQADAQARMRETMMQGAAQQQDASHKQADIALKAQGQQFDQGLALREQLHQEAMDRHSVTMDHHTATHQVTMDHAQHRLAVKQANKPPARVQ